MNWSPVLNTIPPLRSLALIGAVLCGAPARAQDAPVAPYAAVSADPIDVLSAHLRTLSVSPKNYLALIGAGDAALQVGDPNAALGFFARADKVDPASGKAKAGLGAALVALERPDDALPLFAQAVALGVSEASVAKDRGLAYDLRGDPKRAQHDYALALKAGPDDETTRRYALSLGISGERNAAMALLDPLLRKRDQSAWRARAFILAMNGDANGANGIVRQVMPAGLAATMTPFLARLATLNAADRAHAVNFGTMPATGVALAAVKIGDPFTPLGGAKPQTNAGTTGAGLIPTGEPLGPRPWGVEPVRVAAAPLSTEPRRIPGRDPAQVASAAPAPVSIAVPRPVVSPAPVFPAPAAPGFSVTASAPSPANGAISARIGSKVAEIDRSQLPPEARGEGGPSVVVAVPERALPVPTATPPGAAPSADAPRNDAPKAPVAVVLATPSPVPVAIVPPPSAVAMEVASAPAPELIGPPAEGASADAGKAEVPEVEAPPAEAPAVARAAAPVPSSLPVSRLASILDGVVPEAEAPAALPTAADLRAARRLAQKKADAAAALAAAAQAEKEAKAAEAELAQRNPPRLWVQIATGNNTRGLAGTWARIRDANAAALKGKAAWSAPFKATNRLLVGPMKSAADARALVTALSKDGVGATTFSSEAGQEVARVAAK